MCWRFWSSVPHVEQGRTADGEGGDVEDQRHLVAVGLGVEGLLVGDVEAEAAVFAREADAGESPGVEELLQFPGALPCAFVVAAGPGRNVGIQPRHVVGQPGAGAGGERVDGFVDLEGRHAADPWLLTYR